MSTSGLLTIDAFSQKLRARQVTAAETTDECLRRIGVANAELNAFIHVSYDEAREAARRADRELADGLDRGPLHGVPISVKDLFDVRGIRTTAASRVREDHLATGDATVISRLREAGAVLIGKTNLHEFAFGTTNEDSAFGPARNPHDPSRSPGGSSGGSAASVAARMSLGTLGTDTGGSIRIPAAACGIVGLKPTYGELPVDGVVPLSRTLDHVGPLAGTVLDAWHLYQALLGTPGTPPPSAASTRRLRLAIPRRYFLDLVDDEVRARFDESVQKLGREGATIEDTGIHNAGDIAPIYLHLAFGDAGAYHSATLDSMPEKYTAPVRHRLEAARYVLAEDYVRALLGREALTRQVDAALSECDALLLPTLPIPAPVLGASVARIGGSEHPVRNVMLRLTQLFNLTGHPAVSLPCGVTAAGLPCGLQLVGRRHQTARLIEVALAAERTLDLQA
jgi:aspartyl-tRNA(Asn)/glutamyl-tRNA(Gln) amidotransferase subunit A